jgi:DNA-binding transcriptional LysR family regulator
MPDRSSKRYPEWELLMTWLALVETGSVSAASHQLGLSHAAVSQRVKLLEEIFHTSLLDRTSRPARPTAAGARLYDHAAAMLRSADHMVEGVRRISRSKRQIVRLGCTDSVAAAGGPIIIRALSSIAHQVRLWSGSTEQLEAELGQRQLDIAITAAEGLFTDGIRRVELFSEPYVAALPVLASWDSQGSLSELAKSLPLIRYSARSRIGKSIEAYLNANGDTAERTCEFDTTEPLLGMVSMGMGFAITTPLCIWQVRHHIPKLQILPLTAFSRKGVRYTPLSRTFYLSYRESEFEPLIDELCSLIKQTFSRQVNHDVATALSFGKANVISVAF